MITIYHNNRCSKSRNALQLIEESGKSFEVVDYLKNPPSEKELKKLINLLGISPIQLVRTNEQIWKDNYKGKTLTDKALLKAMLTYPKLIERPIVVSNNRAIIGRPPEKIMDLL